MKVNGVMSPLSQIDQITIQPLFDSVKDVNIPLAPPDCAAPEEKRFRSLSFGSPHSTISLDGTPLCKAVDKKGEVSSNFLVQKNIIHFPPTGSLAFYKGYLKQRIGEIHPKKIAGRELFEEIKGKGYRGTLSSLQRFLSGFREKKKLGPEAFLAFHKGYLKQRIDRAHPQKVEARELFEEIIVRGYRGSQKPLQRFLWSFREKNKVTPEASLAFHKDYLKKRVQEATSRKIVGRELFAEITAKGYRGSLRALQRFLSEMRKKEGVGPELSLAFYKEYLKQKVEETYPKKIVKRELFEEIQARGYRGSLRTLQRFLSDVQKKKGFAPQSCLAFHKGYLKQKIEETYPKKVVARELFEEIKGKGYQGTLRTLQTFLSSLREEQGFAPEAYLGFHKDYLKQRMEETTSKKIAARKLFEEIKGRGYQATLRTLQTFLSSLRQEKKLGPESSLAFYKEYLKQKVEEAYPKKIVKKELFEEIKGRGYRGSLSTLQRFLSDIRKEKGGKSGASLA